MHGNESRPPAPSRRNRHDLRPITRQERNIAAELMKISGGPRVFSNLDDPFLSGWLYFCDDRHRKACADPREVANLIHGDPAGERQPGGAPRPAPEAPISLRSPKT